MYAPRTCFSYPQARGRWMGAQPLWALVSLSGNGIMILLGWIMG